MGTRFTLVLPECAESEGAELAELARRFLASQEHLLSRFDPRGPLVALNAGAASAAIIPPPALWAVLQACRDHWRRTEGSFDITIQSLAQVWKRAAMEAREPTAAEIGEAQSRVGLGHVEFDEAVRTVRFVRDGVSIDLGGFGKGWALDSLRAELIRQGVTCALLSFGESSIAVIGRHPAGRPWPVGIADLNEPTRVRHNFALENAALSTSGSAVHARSSSVANAPAHPHLINPLDGRPVRGARTVSVCAPTAAEAEALSTALFVLPAARWPRVLARYPGVEAVSIDASSLIVAGGEVPVEETPMLISTHA